MKLVVLVSLLPCLLEYNSPLFRALSYMYDVQRIQIFKNIHVLKFMYGYKYIVWHLCKTLAARGLGHFYPDIPPREKCK